MRVIYLSSKTYPASTANHVHVRELSVALSKLCDYSVTVAGGDTSEFESVNVISLGNSRRFRTVQHFFWLRRFTETTPHDTVLLSNDAYLLTLAIVIRTIFRRQYLVVSYWHMFFGNLSWFIARGSDGALVLTKGLKEVLSEKYPFMRNALISPDAVNLSIFDISLSREEAREELALPQDARIVLYAGRFKTLREHKGLPEIFDAIVAIPVSDNVSFIAVGGHKVEMEEYTREVEIRGLQGRVRLVPGVPQSTLAVYQKAADALLMYFPDTPHYRTYMSPMKMFEYMASKRPIITSDLPSVREVLSDESAFFVPPEKPDVLAKKIMEVCKGGSRAEAKAERAYADVQNHTWDAKARKVLSFLETFLHA